MNCNDDVSHLLYLIEVVFRPSEVVSRTKITQLSDYYDAKVSQPTLALRGLEEPFFQLCCCVVSVFGSGKKCRNLVYIIFWRIVLGSNGKKCLVLRTYLVYNTVVRLCQFFCCGGKVNLFDYLTVTILSQKYRELSL